VGDHDRMLALAAGAAIRSTPRVLPEDYGKYEPG
jgi:hypothetical protein